MKRIVFLLVILLFLLGCKSSHQTTNVSLEKQQIQEVIDAWHLAASNANFEDYFGLMTADAVFIGTDATENWSVEKFKAFSKPYFDKGKAWSFKAVERNVFLSKNGEIAWFDELLDTWMGSCRGSGVLEKKNDQWKIKQYVLSLTVPNDKVNKVIVLKKKQDSTLFNLK